MTKSLLTVTFVISSLLLFAQKSSNYTLTVDNNGTWYNMGGSTTILGPNQDENTYTPVFNDIGFRFLFMGEFWDQFKISPNGIMWFGKSTDYFPKTANNIGAIPNSRRIAAIANLHGMKTHADGNVKIKVAGTAPNRYAIIRWNNMSANDNSTTKDMKYMVVLHESEYNSNKAGEFKFIYNKVSWGNASGEETTCGFQIDDEADKRFLVNIENDSFSTTTDLRATPAAGTLANLNSTTAPNKKRYQFISNDQAHNNSPLLASCITSNSVRLEWEDLVTGNLGYAIYISEDGLNYSILKNEGRNATSSLITGLNADTEYWFRIHAYNEGKLDKTGSIISVRTLTEDNIIALKSGDWSDPTIWSTGKVPTAAHNVTIGCSGNYTVSVDQTAQCNNIAVESGSMLTLSNTKEIFVNGDFTNNGTCDYKSNNTKVILRGDLSNNGIWNAGTSSQTIFNGSADQVISNTQTGIAESSIEENGSVAVNDRTWASFPINIPSTLSITSLQGVEVDIDHTYNSDMNIWLRSPSGQEIQLANRAGGSGNNYNNVLFRDDASANLPTGSTSISGTFKPYESLSSLTNVTAGQWTLRVYDNEYYDRGTIKRVKLIFEIPTSAPNITVQNLEIVNNGGRVISTTDIKVNGHLKLSNGVLDMYGNTNTQNNLYLSENASADPAHDNTYVFGKIIKKGNTDFNFPVGHDGHAANAFIRFAGGNADDEFSVAYFHRNPSMPNNFDSEAPYGNGIDATMTEISGKEYWLIEQEKNANTPVYIKLSYQDGRSGTINNPGDLVVSHYTYDSNGNRHWKNEGLGDISSSEITSAAPISSFSPFTIGTGSGGNTLPVEWLSFDVEGEGNIATINWSAIEYADSDYYQLERSTNGIGFEVVDIIDIHAEGKQEYSYSNTLSYELAGTEVFYRIKQVDIDGSANYTELGSYTVQYNQASLELYPLPAQENITLTLDENAPAPEHISIINTSGQAIDITAEYEAPKTTFDISHLPSGLYTMKIVIGQQVMTKQFAIQ